jgi:tRNA(fMet)-specific endonuclease VapC
MLVLDTDHMSLLEWGAAESARLRERLADVSPDDLATTIISYEEQMRGWMAYVARAKSMAQQLKAYRRLRQHLDNYLQVTVLDFDEAAVEEFQRLQRERIRIGTMDLKIAAIALSRNATLLSRNTVDFNRVPNLRLEDWTK